MLDHRFYVGPLGDLQPLPDQGRATSPLAVIGGTHTSLTGAFTRDVYGHVRSWSWTYPGLTVAELTWIEALQLRLVPGPIYLIDPRRSNRLPVDLATGGSVRGDPRVAAATGNSVAYWRPLHHITLPDHRTLPSRLLLRGALWWQTLDDQPSGLEATGPAVDRRRDIPVLPGEPLGFSVWATGTGTLTGTLAVHDRTETPVASATSGPVALDPTTWTEVATGEVAVPDGARHGRVRLDRSGPPGDTYVTALSCHRLDDPELAPGLHVLCPPTDVTGGQRLGGGGPRVVAVDNPASAYLAPGLTTTALTLTERT